MIKTNRQASMKTRWETPPLTMDYIRDRFGPFDLDPCCEAHTAKAPTFFTETRISIFGWRRRMSNRRAA